MSNTANTSSAVTFQRDSNPHAGNPSATKVARALADRIDELSLTQPAGFARPIESAGHLGGELARLTCDLRAAASSIPALSNLAAALAQAADDLTEFNSVDPCYAELIRDEATRVERATS